MDSIIELITEKTYLPFTTCNKSNQKLFIYGAGTYASCYIHNFISHNIPVAGILLDDQYYTSPTYQIDNIELPVYSLKDTSIYQDQIVLISFYRATEKQIAAIEKYASKVLCYDFSCVSLFTYEYNYITENIQRFTAAYNKIDDQESKDLFIAYINQRISGNIDYCRNRVVPNRYFDSSIIHLTDHESFVDCGAYNGDSIYGFIDALHDQNIDTYNDIFAFEPDSNNYKMLQQNCRELPNVTYINKGAYDEVTTLHFNEGQNKSSNIDDHGTSVIKTTLIDNIVGNRPVTFIKMDIQGAEEAALKGARQTIISNRPRLAVCLSHRPQDLYLIIEYLESLSLSYKYYLRMQGAKYSDICLIAIPR